MVSSQGKPHLASCSIMKGDIVALSTWKKDSLVRNTGKVSGESRDFIQA